MKFGRLVCCATSVIAVFDNEGKMTNTRMPFPYVSGRDGYVFTAPVGRFRPNTFGLYDMHGNVWEWCQDQYAADYYAKSPVDDPQGPREGSSRVLRGGGWNNTPVSVRSAARDVEEATFRLYSIGFRVVRERE
jgi:sulfatase modifying factor 1